MDTKDPVLREMSRLLKASVTNCLVHWYGMKVVSFGQKVNLVVCNEINPTSLQAMVSAIPKQKDNPAIVVLCAHDTRFNHTPHLEDSTYNISYVAKPVGPLKLAKAITSCLDGVPPSATPGIDSSLSHSPENSDLSSTFDSLTLSPQGGEVLDNSRMSADSLNARKALESPTPQATIEKSAEFPFPNPPIPEEPEELTHGVTMTSTKGPLAPFASSSTQPASKTLTDMMKSSSSKTRNKKPNLPMLDSPTFLLVDDNHINMSLLSTYVKRRNFTIVHEAANGLDAVKAVKAREDGYDIIFMDITMPVMDGFEATHQIRALEVERKEKGGLRKPALIIAFTGRSSMEDQVEAKRVGLDLFMTKPVSLKEVGKIIDNWSANSERGS
jgi:CheY-like chemotaxis protein